MCFGSQWLIFLLTTEVLETYIEAFGVSADVGESDRVLPSPASVHVVPESELDARYGVDAYGRLGCGSAWK